jgi:hypothetical protein
MDSVRHSHSVIAAAVDGIASACVQDPDDRLFELLSSTIDDCIAFTRPKTQDITVSEPVQAPEVPAERPRVSQHA